MFKNLLIASIAALFVSIVSAKAATVTIDFGEYSDMDFESPDTYSEDNFTFTAESGSEYAIYLPDGTVPSPTGNTLVVGYGAAVGDNDTISIKRNNGGLFTFDSVDYRSATYFQDPTFSLSSGYVSDGVNLVGLVDDVVVFTIFVDSSVDVWDTLYSQYSNWIDELQIVGASQGDTPLYLDNFVFSEVPLPAAIWMFIAGLGGLGFARKKQAT